MIAHATSTQPAARLEGYSYNAWYLAGWTTSFDAQLSAVKILNEPIVLYRTEAKQWVALEDLCPHKLVPLSLGELIGSCLRCHYHGLKFAADGQCVEIPGQPVVPAAVRVRTYPVTERHGGVWIWMGVPGRADESEVPDIIGEGDPGYIMFPGAIEVDGAARLLWDNLLDLSHIPFVHFSSLVFGDQEMAAKVLAGEVGKHSTPYDRGIRMDRWHFDQRRQFELGDDRPVDEHIITDFSAPGLLTIRTFTYPAGIRDSYSDGNIPETELLLSSFACQIVTPVTERTCKIFLGIGAWDKAPFNPALREVAGKAIIEDRNIIEAQQAVMRANPNRKPMMLSMDRDVARFRSIMKRLIEQESELAAAASDVSMALDRIVPPLSV